MTVKPTSNAGVLRVTFGAGNKFDYSLAKKQLNGRHAVHDRDDGKIDLHLYVDRAMWDLFFENGSVYLHQARRDIGKPLKTLKVEMLDGGAGVIENMKVHEVRSIWPKAEPGRP